MIALRCYDNGGKTCDRYTILPADVQTFARQSFTEEDPRPVAYLKKDRQERFNLKRAWFVNAWRIVDAEGTDLVQPWSNTKSGARAVAASLNYRLLED